MEKEYGDGQRVLRWLSAETIVSVLIMLIGLGTVYGSLSTRLELVASEVHELQERDITPGAREQIAAIQSNDRALQAQIDELREEMRSQRREIIESLNRLEQELKAHDKK